VSRYGPWATLALDPTSDKRAIKQAYARLLKRTRPDDDPAGYQALREAYDQALQAASWLGALPWQAGIARDGADADPRADSLAGPGRTPETLVDAHVYDLDIACGPQQSECRPVFDLADRLAARPSQVLLVAGCLGAQRSRTASPPVQALSEALLLALAEGGMHAVLQAWPQVRNELLGLPIEQSGEASCHFADLLLADEELPYGLLQLLAGHFGWGSDYRADAALGAARSSALARHLQERAARRHLEDYADGEVSKLLRLWVAAERRELPGWRAKLFALGSPGTLAARLEVLPRASFRCAGVRPTSIRPLREQAAWGNLARCGVLSLVFLLSCTAVLGLPPVKNFVVLAMVGAVLTFAAIVATHRVDLSQRLTRQRQLRWVLNDGESLAMMVGAAGASALAAMLTWHQPRFWAPGHEGASFVALLLLALGLLAGWPMRQPWRLALPALWVMGVQVWPTGLALPPGPMAQGGLVFMLLCLFQAGVMMFKRELVEDNRASHQLLLWPMLAAGSVLLLPRWPALLLAMPPMVLALACRLGAMAAAIAPLCALVLWGGLFAGQVSTAWLMPATALAMAMMNAFAFLGRRAAGYAAAPLPSN
jgi:uncharacterized membrane protein